MRAGILTFLAHSYGAVLQAYALQVTLKRMGVEPQGVDYCPAQWQAGQTAFFPWSSLHHVVLNSFVAMRFRQVKRRMSRFEAFKQAHLRLTERRYWSREELTENLPNYDAFICGSDQIWRPSQAMDAVFFLDFVNDPNARRIAYAPSFGVSSVPAEKREEVARLVKAISFLSVREDMGRAIIQELTGRDAEIVLDPSLLLTAEDWSKIALQPRVEPPYILVYCLEQRRLFFDLVRHVKRLTGLPVVVIASHAGNLIRADHVVFDAGPEEFVGLFAHAACVCTNSFHGTAFSVIHERPVWTTPHSLANSRLSSLLKLLGLLDRQITHIGNPPENPLDSDYGEAGGLLAQQREKSIEFLRNALGVPNRGQS